LQGLVTAPDGTRPDVALHIEAGELEMEGSAFRVPVAALYAGTWLVEAT
jgi:hypothetical protein